jgi:predicted TIM-barrel fold metal-dependent hydrolase
VNVFDQLKIDTHCHLFDPINFPYARDVAYRPQGQEIGSQAYFEQLMDCFNVRHAVLVEPNSGYNGDNRCLLHALDTGRGRFKGIAVVPADIRGEALDALRLRGVIGVAFNVAMYGVDHYAGIVPLLRLLAELGLWAQFQVEGNQLLELLPMIERVPGVRLVFDHHGRPVVAQGIDQPGFQTLLALGREGRAIVKLSGEAKFSTAPFPFDDTRPYTEALVQAFGLEHCVWASDWPFLRAPFRLDFGVLLKRWEHMFTPAERDQLMNRSARTLFSFE